LVLALLQRFNLQQFKRFSKTRSLRAIALLSFGLLTIRALPYLAPIRAGELIQQQQSAEFRDRNGLVLGTVLTRDQEHTVAVPLDQVSPHFLSAIVAAEDQRFYHHGAVDERAVARAMLEAAQAKQVVSGASTITMQLARMLDPAPRNLPSKLKEIWTAWRLEAGMDKAQILHAYVNRLPMGGNIYGVEAASRIYFGIAAKDLSIAQASLLAAIPNDPNRLNPYSHLLALKQRQAYVLERMVQDGFITQAEGDRALAAPVALQSRQQGIVAAPHFLFWLSDRLPTNHSAQVSTTLDRPLQEFVEAQVSQVVRSLSSQNVHHAAAIVVHNATGEVLAYVGSPDYFADAQMGRNDGVQALRQPGSTLKPFLYQLALEKRLLQPNTILADVPTRYAIPGAKLYNPSDFSETFQGPVRVRVALANSLNVPAVKVLEKVGVPTFLDRLHGLGFTQLTQPADHYGLGLTLGSGEVSLWELAQAYWQMARQGDRGQLHVYKNSNGATPKPEEQTASETGQTAARASWLLVTDMLSDRHARARAFGVNSLLALPFPAAVKTGTSSDYRDTWTVGFTREYTVAVWVGNFDNAPMQKVSGVMGAAPLWNRIMLHLHDRQEPAAFPAPPGLVQRPICALSGAKPTTACPAIVQEYLFPEALTAYNQNPDPFFGASKNGSSKNGAAQNGERDRPHLPAEYSEWLAMQSSPTFLSTQDAAKNLRILAPRNGDVFLIGDSSQPDPTQKLQFKLASPPNQPVQWLLNGQAIGSSANGSLFWNPKPGAWTLQATSQGKTDTIRFQVDVAKNRPDRRGFSYAKTN
jgi:penicillin-binding protein 1C